MKKNLVKLNPQEAAGVTRRGRGTRDGATKRFRAGQKVRLDCTETATVIERDDDHYTIEVCIRGLEFRIWKDCLRPLTKRERS